MLLFFFLPFVFFSSQFKFFFFKFHFWFLLYTTALLLTKQNPKSCGERVVGYVYEYNTTTIESNTYIGECKTQPVGNPTDKTRCLCELPPDAKKLSKEWVEELLPEPECTEEKCSGKGKGGKSLIYFSFFLDGGYRSAGFFLLFVLFVEHLFGPNGSKTFFFQ